MLLLLLFSHSLEQYHRQLVLCCHGKPSVMLAAVVTMVITELDCEQTDWPEMRLLRDKESQMRYIAHDVY